MTSSLTCTIVPAGRLQGFCEQALQRAGASEEDARITADVLVTTDTWGIFTHGTKLLKGYLRRLNAGGLRTDARPAIVAEGLAWARIDGASVLGQVAATYAMRTAIAKARIAGVGYAGLFNSCHFGAAGYYTALAAAEGMIGISMANDIPSVAAPGSRRAVTGSNPFSYAVPVPGGDPILLDMATSTVAGGKVYAAHQRGEVIPEHWIVGPDGRPTRDGSLYPHQAALTPMAGHKGYGIAVLIETLSAVLTGAAVTWNVGSWIFGDQSQPTNHGAAFLAFHLDAMMPHAEFAERIQSLVREIHEAPTAEGADRIYLPGEIEAEKRRLALQQGIPLPADVMTSLHEVASETKLDFDQILIPER